MDPLLSHNYFVTYGGRRVPGHSIRLLPRDEIEGFNERIRGQWFNEGQLFFAEGEAENVADYYYLDAQDQSPRPVRYFHLTPTETGICSDSIESFLSGIVDFKTGARNKESALGTKQIDKSVLRCFEPSSD